MKSLAYSKSREYHRKYTRKWRAAHPNYTRNWNRLNRNVRVKDITLPNQTSRVKKINKKFQLCYVRVKKGHCNKCTILLTSNYAVGHNGVTCGECLKKLSTGISQL